MPLRLVTGPANAGKTGFVHAALISGLETCVPVLALPSTPDAKAAAEEFAARGHHGVAVVVLDSWISELWLLYGDGRALVTPAARRALIGAAIDRVDLGQLALSGNTPGFADTVAVVARGIVDPVVVEGPTALAVTNVLREYSALLDRSGLIEPAGAAVLLGESPPPVPGPVGLNRFTDLTPGQERFIVGISRVAEVLIALTWEPDSPATQYVDPLIGRLVEAGAVVQTATDEARTDSGLERVTRTLFVPGGSQPPPTSLMLAQAPGPEGECALVAALAREALSEGRTVAITFRELARREGLLAAAMAAQAVEYSLDVVTPLRHTPFGRALFALLGACEGNADARELLAGFLLSPFSGVEEETSLRLDRQWRRSRAHARAMLGDVRQLGGSAGRVVEAAGAVTTTVLGPAAANKWQDLTDELLAPVLGTPLEVRSAAAQRAVTATISELVGVPGLETTVGEVRAILERTNVVVTGPATPGAALVTEPERIRGRRFDTVIVGGLTAVEFSGHGARPLAAQLLENLGQPAAPDIQAQERSLFHSVLTRARSSLVLSWQTADEKGDPLRRSTHLEEVLDLFRGPGEDGIPAGIRMRSASGCVAPSDVERPRGAQRHEGISGAPVRGTIADVDVLEALTSRSEFSISEIETYLSCPYRWYYSRAIAPASISSSFEAREKGSVAHDVLAEFYRRWGSEGPRRIEGESLSEALGMLELVIDEQSERRRPGLRGAREEFAFEEAMRWTRRVVTADVGYLPGCVPIAHELAFGERQGRVAVVRGVPLRGSVDRVDLDSNGGLIITDYKSSSTISGAASFASKGLVQVALYLAVACGLHEAEPSGCLYRSLKSGVARGAWRADRVACWPGARDGDGTDEAGILTVIAGAAEAMERAVEGIRDGIIGPVPRTDGSCMYCEARVFCEEARS